MSLHPLHMIAKTRGITKPFSRSQRRAQLAGPIIVVVLLRPYRLLFVRFITVCICIPSPLRVDIHKVIACIVRPLPQCILGEFCVRVSVGNVVGCRLNNLLRRRGQGRRADRRGVRRPDPRAGPHLA